MGLITLFAPLRVPSTFSQITRSYVIFTLMWTTLSTLSFAEGSSGTHGQSVQVSKMLVFKVVCNLIVVAR